jgi:hypothetical protein
VKVTVLARNGRVIVSRVNSTGAGGMERDLTPAEARDAAKEMLMRRGVTVLGMTLDFDPDVYIKIMDAARSAEGMK